MNELKPYHIELLIQEIARRKLQNSRYSLRAFARHLGIAPSTLSRVLSNTQELSVSGSRKILRKLKFTEEQKLIFISSVAEEKKRRALQLLARGLGKLDADHDYGFSVDGVIDIALRALADACVIGFHRQDNCLVVHAKHREDAFADFYQKMSLIRDLTSKACPDDESCLITPDDDPEGILQQLGASSLIIVPLLAEDRRLGLLTLIRSGERSCFSHQDVSIAVELGIRAILASGSLAHSSS
jgi:transcriptional regulator with XRE-family HTH domain